MIIHLHHTHTYTYIYSPIPIYPYPLPDTYTLYTPPIHPSPYPPSLISSIPLPPARSSTVFFENCKGWTTQSASPKRATVIELSFRSCKDQCETPPKHNKGQPAYKPVIPCFYLSSRFMLCDMSMVNVTVTIQYPLSLPSQPHNPQGGNHGQTP